MQRRDDSDNFRGELLALGRQARGLTQQDLAKIAGVTQAFVSFVEDGRRQVSDEQWQVFARELQFPPAFFSQKDPVLGLGVGELFHRRRKTMSAKTLSQVHAWMNIQTFAIRRLIRAVDWPAVDLPVWTLGIDVDSEETAAEMVRAKWYVPDGPIRSVTAIIDRAGLMTLPTPFLPAEIDAIGMWPSDLPPLVFANPDALQDRLRFTLMHEVGHLALHQRSALLTVNPDIEAEANRFAAAFLMPRREIRPQLRDLTLDKLGHLKRVWRVSMAALLMRAKQLETITPVQEKTLWAAIGRNGWRKREPVQLDVFGENLGSLYSDLFGLYRNDLKYSENSLAELTNLCAVDLRQWIAPTTIGPRLL